MTVLIGFPPTPEGDAAFSAATPSTSFKTSSRLPRKGTWAGPGRSGPIDVGEFESHSTVSQKVCRGIALRRPERS